MPPRQDVIASSIQYSIINPDKPASTLDKLQGYFYIHWVTFECIREDLFSTLREAWKIKDGDYRASFGQGNKQNALKPMGDMGYSGSTFFSTFDSRYLVKSVPRRFEHSFFKHDMLVPYVEHMQKNQDSLLVRITDFLECTQHSVGSIFGFAPSHHMVMENIMYGKDQDKRSKQDETVKWQSWDLKPMSYFYPERDVAGGALSSEATKSKLADDFEEKMVLTLDDAEHFKAQIQKDTALLQKCNAVDYSLFLVRIPTGTVHSEEGSRPVPPSEPPFTPPDPPSWRTGIKSADGQHVYRASILDFFWAKHKVHAKAMTGLIETYNVIDPKGPMSVTTTSEEYRGRFLHMCSEIIEVQDQAGQEG